MAVAGMILGIIGVVFAFIPVFGAFVAIPCVGVGMPLAAVAFYQARKKLQFLDRNEHVLLVGPVGVGKSFIA